MSFSASSIHKRFSTGSVKVVLIESSHRQCEVTPHFFIGTSVKYIEKSIAKRSILTQSIQKSFLIDPLSTNNAVYRDLLTIKKKT